MFTELVELRSGLVLPAAVIALGCALEARGYVFRRQGDRLQIVRSLGGYDSYTADTLTDIDRAAIAQYKFHLLAVVDLMDHNNM